MRLCMYAAAAVMIGVGSVGVGRLTAQVYDGNYANPYGASYHSSTAEEGMANGFANIVRSAGQANLTNAQAATEAERARSAYLQNRALATQTYFDMRKMNAQYREGERSKPLSQEQYIRIAKEAAPDRLSPSELDPFSGTIQWPPQLRGKPFAAQRATLETLYQQRAHGNLQTYQAIKAACAALNAALKANIDTMPPMDFVRAKNFIDSLAYESNFALR